MPSPRLSPIRREIEFGPWRAQLVEDDLVDLRCGGIPVLRGIRAVVRDADWRTLEPRIRSIDFEPACLGPESAPSPDSERIIRLEVDYSGWGSEYRGALTIRLNRHEVAVDFRGTAVVGFRGNRVGLVVLHHPENAGVSVSVTAPDGSETGARFPIEISPHQPFTNIAALQWRQDCLSVALRFVGDVFETEDQRNWTDASFKTYSTPLALPFPVDHPAGSEVRQSVVVTAEPDSDVGSDAPTLSAASSDTVSVLSVSAGTAGRVPALSVAATTGPPSAGGQPEPIAGLESVLVELEGTMDDRRLRLEGALRDAVVLGVPLDVRIVASDPEELAATLDLVATVDVIRLAVYDPITHVTEPQLWRALRDEAAARSFSGSLVAGTRAHFTELNRTSERLSVDAAGVTFSITPQMHATDIDSVVQTLPMQAVVARNARRIAGARPLAIGPITLRQRFNAVATSEGDGDDAANEPASDELQHHSFAAAWLLGSVAALSSLDQAIGSICLFEAAGPRGFRTDDGRLDPAGCLLRVLASLRGSELMRLGTTLDAATVVYPVRTPHAVVLFVANLHHRRRSISITIDEATDADHAHVEVFGSGRPVEATINASADTTLLSAQIDAWTAIAVTSPRWTEHEPGR